MDLPERLVMTPGQTFSADLPGLGGAGYLWFVQIVDPSDSSPDAVVAATIERGGAGQQLGPDDARPSLGASLPETLLITAQATGTATIQVVQRRPWESGPPRVERHTQVVVVSAAPDTAKTLDEPAPSEDTRQERDR